ncbi:isoprenyl transferase [Pontivivens insulae]|uniref:Isoprenyl transferase n=1 Tax=Pontivivens insulae TaxID=1639689 RepID=A0A2R8AAR0_9RHOB|nr:isoprenyl transferase [Pontivivens insulae]RED13209.1 undecaprenyl diphosphate synthase [Pontivivens insulae]SPF29301.1 Ditrans,polycis-undecaprenyl-diphosphate synthase ((2E,6E)-farnesyl-diphosphate specific) [Pontivivens insulae]
MSRSTQRPTHVAIIMDGNGRWAVRRGLPRVAGHKKGVQRVREIVRSCPELGVETLTLYAFSTENWKRPVIEVAALMRLFRIYIRMEAVKLIENGVRVRFIGERSALEEDIRAMMLGLEQATKDNDRLTLQIALNYGGRDEIVRAMRNMGEAVAHGALSPDDINEALLSAHLDTHACSDPDLVIRTSGEYRTSNFLPWQAAYSEYAFVPECWPDFTPKQFGEILDAFGLRERRFGAVEAQGSSA